jgi:hypothetical protein
LEKILPGKNWAEKREFRAEWSQSQPHQTLQYKTIVRPQTSQNWSIPKLILSRVMMTAPANGQISDHTNPFDLRIIGTGQGDNAIGCINQALQFCF